MNAVPNIAALLDFLPRMSIIIVNSPQISNNRYKVAARLTRHTKMLALFLYNSGYEIDGNIGLDYLRVEITAATRKRLMRCSELHRLGRNEVDVVRSTRPKGNFCRL